MINRSTRAPALASIAFCLGWACAIGAPPASAQSRVVTFASWGGTLQQAQTEAFARPAEAKLGIKVLNETHGGSYANVKAQVAAGNVTYDLVGMGAAECARAVREGNLEKIDFALVPNIKDIPRDLVTEYCVPLFSYSNVIAWNTKKYGQNGPKTWAEFWDVKKFPGTRSLRGYPRQTFEAALLADGVKRETLYPIDVDRAYRKLEEIKPHVVAWWASGAQSTQLLANGEADAILIWNGRVAAAVREGASATYTYSDGVFELETMFIPRGAKNKENAMRLMNELLDPVNQANFSNLIDYGPTNPKAFDTGILSPERAKSLPSYPENLKEQVLLQADWYTTSEADKAIERWTSFVQRR
jgi:putative spermidine/putrescine transport system substrate-binding protein